MQFKNKKEIYIYLYIFYPKQNIYLPFPIYTHFFFFLSSPLEGIIILNIPLNILLFFLVVFFFLKKKQTAGMPKYSLFLSGFVIYIIMIKS